ncbi:MAG TPA: hypothetical protein VFJ05_04205 [Nitrososphaeraceae archaeon]|nr:hypothetical protein [Nitrososphaeraceae archaeon]
MNFHYSVGFGKIYNTEELEKERKQPYFRREFELAYSVGTGNVFTEQSIQAAEDLGRKYKSRTSFEGTQKSLGIDPGFGSSKTAFTVIEYVDNLAHVIYSKQFENSSTEHMVSHAWNKEAKISYYYLMNAESCFDTSIILSMLLLIDDRLKLSIA